MYLFWGTQVIQERRNDAQDFFCDPSVTQSCVKNYNCRDKFCLRIWRENGSNSSTKDKKNRGRSRFMKVVIVPALIKILSKHLWFNKRVNQLTKDENHFLDASTFYHLLAEASRTRTTTLKPLSLSQILKPFSQPHQLKLLKSFSFISLYAEEKRNGLKFLITLVDAIWQTKVPK